MILQTKTRQFIREVAEETGLSFNQVKDIALSAQYKYLITEMAKGQRGEPSTFKNIIIRFIGTFRASPGKIFHMTKAIDDKIKRDQENEKYTRTI